MQHVCVEAGQTIAIRGSAGQSVVTLLAPVNGNGVALVAVEDGTGRREESVSRGDDIVIGGEEWLVVCIGRSPMFAGEGLHLAWG